MSILSRTVSITRYQVQGKLENPVIEQVLKGLEANRFKEIEDHSETQATGWTSFDHPFQPNFAGSAFVVDTHFVFSLRIDKKTLPPKVLKKDYVQAMEKKLAESGRDYLSKTEKKQLQEDVENALSLRVPAVPNVYDLIWRYEENDLWFFTNQKAINEALETLFHESFKLNLIRLFPYTMGELRINLTDAQKDRLNQLTPLPIGK